MEDLGIYLYYTEKRDKKEKHYAGYIALHTDRKIRFIEIPTKKHSIIIDLKNCKVKKVKR